MSILVTGHTGFLGQVLVRYLQPKFSSITLVGRRSLELQSSVFYQREMSSDADYSDCLSSIDVVIHCAARVHIMNDEASDPIMACREVNTYGTLNLAKQAVKAGVKRFVFISSIKVNGESTDAKRPFTANDVHNPQDPYGLSKSEAESQLLALGQETGMEIVIIRPPLVYGPGVKANFASLLNLASKGLPLPFGCFNTNRRSMVSVDNLVDLIVTCIDHPKAANQVFLVSDDEDLSTAQLISRLSRACGKSGFLLPIPVFLFKVVARVLRKKDVIERLSGSLRVDISKTKDVLSWSPPQSVDDGFKLTAEAFLKVN